ncbi:MAG: hypothetical protein ABIZ91_00375 [Gemmatimonadaceae bacterium]
MMRTILHIWNLVTNDAMALTAAGVLVLAVLGLLVLLAWPSRPAPAVVAHPSRTPRNSNTPRSVEARQLVESGTSPAEVARRTGLSRDALALLMAPATIAARQKAPRAARTSWLQRMRGGSSRAKLTA